MRLIFNGSAALFDCPHSVSVQVLEVKHFGAQRDDRPGAMQLIRLGIQSSVAEYAPHCRHLRPLPHCGRMLAGKYENSGRKLQGCRQAYRAARQYIPLKTRRIWDHDGCPCPHTAATKAALWLPRSQGPTPAGGLSWKMTDVCAKGRNTDL
jgi:hypothetical protein